MTWGLTLYPTVIGYLFLRQWNYTRFEIPHDSGYHVLFKSIIAGMALFPVPYLIATSFAHFLPSIYPLVLWKIFVPFDSEGTLVMILIEAFAGAWSLNKIARFNADTCLRRTIRDRGDLIGNLMVDIATSREFVEISLKNRKSYIGIPIHWNNIAGKHVELIPYWSGYREEDTQQHKITTHYSPIVRDHREKGTPLSGEDIRLVIPSSEIVSARPFIPSLYRRFQQTSKPT
ncbi:MAG: hypothetical protein OXM03_01465 [Chloroflexota bacterium]|nr:hypothetical protein [Chloroflexota bacterium]MDE2839276.1 hypothetical protein [Chloroflexota bacterium]